MSVSACPLILSISTSASLTAIILGASADVRAHSSAAAASSSACVASDADWVVDSSDQRNFNCREMVFGLVQAR